MITRSQASDIAAEAIIDEFLIVAIHDTHSSISSLAIP